MRVRVYVCTSFVIAKKEKSNKIKKRNKIKSFTSFHSSLRFFFRFLSFYNFFTNVSRTSPHHLQNVYKLQSFLFRVAYSVGRFSIFINTLVGRTTTRRSPTDRPTDGHHLDWHHERFIIAFVTCAGGVFVICTSSECVSIRAGVVKIYYKKGKKITK